MQEQILALLPFKSSFRFVDSIESIDSNHAAVTYTPRPGAFFYEDHFEGYPVTPGSILTEIMAQGGLVVPGIFLLLQESDAMPDKRRLPLLVSANVEFYKLIFPGEKLHVISEKKYFRFNKLKCDVRLVSDSGQLLAKGIFSGMIKELV